MSTIPWGTMNGWLRTEGEQRGAWLARRVQDVRAVQVARPGLTPVTPLRRAEPRAATRRAVAQQPCADVA